MCQGILSFLLVLLCSLAPPADESVGSDDHRAEGGDAHVARGLDHRGRLWPAIFVAFIAGKVQRLYGGNVERSGLLAECW